MSLSPLSSNYLALAWNSASALLNQGGQDETEAVDMKKIIAEHQETQQKLTNEMLRAVQGIKENSMLARTIIKADNAVSVVIWAGRLSFQITF